MAEAEEPDLADSSSPAGEGNDPVAIALTLGQGGALDPRAAAYLEEQTRLAKLQIERMRALDDHLDEEQRLQLSHLRIRRFSDYSKMALELSAGLFFLAIVVGLGVMAWNAAHDHDLVIEAFAVPPDLAARGLTGQAVAAELLDKFGAMEAAVEPTAQGTGSYHLNAGDVVRIAIPETGGVSIGDLDRFMRAWLGHEVHVSGEVAHTANGYAMTVRSGNAPGVRVEGNDLDKLASQAAEKLFAQVEPVRYADFLADGGRFDEAITLLQPLTLVGAPRDRALALTSWAEALDFDGQAAKAREIAQEAVRLVPDASSYAYAVISDAENESGREQQAFAAESAVVRFADRTWSSEDRKSPALRTYPVFMAARRDAHTGDFTAAAADWDQVMAEGGVAIPEVDASLKAAETVPALAKGHNIEAATRMLALIPDFGHAHAANLVFAHIALGYVTEDWRGVIQRYAELGASSHLDPYFAAWEPVVVRPLAAVAMARLGDITGAEALIAKTSYACDLCVRARGTIAALKHDWGASARWYGIVAARSPSIPFADTDWGRMLLWKGDTSGAIAKFEAAHRIGPHFADPLEMWGEALMLQNRSDLALAKFAEADQDAPNWGRLHLEWGKALFYAGHTADSKKQIAIASALDLSQADRFALTQWMKSHG